MTGAYPLDVDSDGHIDLVVLRVGEDVILRGLGGCRFERANEALGLDGGDAWTVAFSATWEGANDLPTLAFGDYLEADHQTCEDSRLVRPAADGGYAEPIALSPGYCTCRCCSATGTVGPSATCASPTTATTTARDGPAVADRAR